MSSFGEFEPLVSETYKYFEDICIKKHSFPYDMKMPGKWTDEFIDWEKQVREKNMTNNSWVTILDGKALGRVIGGNFKKNNNSD